LGQLLFFKETNVSILAKEIDQIKLIIGDSKDIYNVTKDFY